MRRQLLIPQEKVPFIINFKPPTFVFPPPKDIVLLKNNHPTSSPSNSGSSSLFLKKNLFSLPKLTLLFWRKEKEPLPPSSSSFFFHAVIIVEVVVVNDVAAVEVTVTTGAEAAEDCRSTVACASLVISERRFLRTNAVACAPITVVEVVVETIAEVVVDAATHPLIELVPSFIEIVAYPSLSDVVAQIFDFFPYNLCHYCNSSSIRRCSWRRRSR